MTVFHFHIFNVEISVKFDSSDFYLLEENLFSCNGKVDFRYFHPEIHVVIFFADVPMLLPLIFPVSVMKR